MHGANERNEKQESGEKNLFFSPKGGRNEEEKRNPAHIDMSFLLTADTNVSKVALSILFFHSLY